jgi:hypothetical protein
MPLAFLRRRRAFASPSRARAPPGFLRRRRSAASSIPATKGFALPDNLSRRSPTSEPIMLLRSPAAGDRVLASAGAVSASRRSPSWHPRSRPTPSSPASSAAPPGLQPIWRALDVQQQRAWPLVVVGGAAAAAAIAAAGGAGEQRRGAGGERRQLLLLRARASSLGSSSGGSGSLGSLGSSSSSSSSGGSSGSPPAVAAAAVGASAAFNGGGGGDDDDAPDPLGESRRGRRRRFTGAPPFWVCFAPLARFPRPTRVPV